MRVAQRLLADQRYDALPYYKQNLMTWRNCYFIELDDIISDCFRHLKDQDKDIIMSNVKPLVEARTPLDEHDIMRLQERITLQTYMLHHKI